MVYMTVDWVSPSEHYLTVALLLALLQKTTLPSYSRPSSLYTALQTSPIFHSRLFFPGFLFFRHLINSLLDNHHETSYQRTDIVTCWIGGLYHTPVSRQSRPTCQHRNLHWHWTTLCPKSTSWKSASKKIIQKKYSNEEFKEAYIVMNAN